MGFLSMVELCVKFYSLISLFYNVLIISIQLRMKYLLEEFGTVEKVIYLENWFLKVETYHKKGMSIQFSKARMPAFSSEVKGIQTLLDC